jgi:hypothetical protein
MEEKYFNKGIELLRYLFKYRFDGSYHNIPKEFQDVELLLQLINNNFIEREDLMDDEKKKEDSQEDEKEKEDLKKNENDKKIAGQTLKFWEKLFLKNPAKRKRLPNEQVSSDELKYMSNLRVRITPNGVNEVRFSRSDEDIEEQRERNRSYNKESFWKRNKYIIPSLIISSGIIFSPLITDITMDAIHHSSNHTHPENFKITIENVNSSNIDSSFIQKSIIMSATDFVKLYTYYTNKN